MTHIQPYYFIKRRRCRLLISSGISSIIFFSILLLINPFYVAAQPTTVNNKNPDIIYQNKSGENEPTSSDYDEMQITLNVPRIGSIEIPAVIYGETAYLPVKDLFDFLKIRNNLASDRRSIQGFFMDPRSIYNIDKSQNLITYSGKRFELQPSDIIITETNLYLKSSLYGQVFGLDCRFNFRSLSVNLVTSIELPALQEMKLESMHRNLDQLKGERKADTTISRKFSLFRLGMFDWSFMSNREQNVRSKTRVTLGIGALVAGGETNLFLNIYNDRIFKMKEQYYYWKYVNNESKALRQVTLGKILANPTSTVYESINGIQVNNTPTTFRRSFGTFSLSDNTEPGWLVELYVNNVLINYTRADASGFFTFEVPMVYGNSLVKLRYYGPWGEERTHEQILAIPYNFLPKNQFEYNISAGIVEDNFKSKFSRAQFNYGLSQRITIGGGAEYLSSVPGGFMPFLNASFRISSNMFISGEHIQGVRSKALFSYKHPSNLRVELNYLRYEKDQKAIRINYLEEKKLVVSRPFRGQKYSVFSRLTLNQFTLSNVAKKSRYSSAELLMSAVAYGISSNISTYAIIKETGIPLAYTNLSITFRLPYGINMLPQVRYEYNIKKFSLLKAEVEKSLFKRGFINLSYEWDLKNEDHIFGIGLRYNFSFSQAAMSARHSKKNVQTTESLRGSILFDTRTGYVGLNNHNNVGKGGIIIAPFLDLNCNGKREADEPAAPGLKLRINGGRIQRNERDTTVRVTGLDAYTNYFMELDKGSFDNIAWQLRKSTIRVNITPNHFTYLEVPVSVMSEVTGTVYLNGAYGSNGLGRIIVNIYKDNSVFVARTITEADGYFSYLGLPPGEYSIKVDPEQLRKLNMKSSSAFLPVTLRKTKDGDAVNGLIFILNSADKN